MTDFQTDFTHPLVKRFGKESDEDFFDLFIFVLFVKVKEELFLS